jgi:hypothetical protein
MAVTVLNDPPRASRRAPIALGFPHIHVAGNLLALGMVQCQSVVSTPRVVG